MRGGRPQLWYNNRPMKFLYTYRTQNNKQHRGVIRAASKEAAYAALKAQGIKPGHVDEAPGFFNKLFGKGKRWIVIGVLGALCLTLGVVALSYKSEVESAPVGIANALLAETRHQVIGDTAIIEKGIRTGWAEVFPEEGERFLASFAIPGVPAGQRNTSEDEIKAALARRIEATETDGIEIRQIKAMVEGMKQELRQYLADDGTIVEYGQALVQRQEEELGYYNRAKTEIENAKRTGMNQAQLVELWEKRNNALRRMGVKLVPLPE